MGKGKAQVRIIKEQRTAPIEKADTSVQLTTSEAYNAGDWITPVNDMRGLRQMVKHSTILPQCIRAYKNNIAGFGIGIRYVEDVEETPEMAAEFKRAEEIVELLNTEQDTKEVFEDVIEARETYGIAYLEVIRNLAGEVVQIEFIKETPSVSKTKPLDPYIPSIYYHHGQQVERKKRYCKYKQEVGGKTVYFKEFGDPRIMDRRDGLYLQEGKSIDLDNQANEIMEFAIGGGAVDRAGTRCGRKPPGRGTEQQLFCQRAAYSADDYSQKRHPYGRKLCKASKLHERHQGGSRATRFYPS